MFFDVAQTNIKSANKILSNYSPNLTLCDSYYNDNVHFYSKKFKFLWTHVRVNPNLDFSTNINQYNSLLHERLARNINSLRKGNCLCLICLYYDTQDTPDDLHELERVIKTYNETNKIFVIDYWGREGGILRVSIIINADFHSVHLCGTKDSTTSGQKVLNFIEVYLNKF